MRVALYARVSTTRQAQAQTITQQLARLHAYAAERGWAVDEQHLYRDDGYSGAALARPGLDRLRDCAAFGELDLILLTSPDRLARKYVHQVLLIEEFERQGCRVEFLERPMSTDPHDQLLLQIRGAVAEYERTLIAERMRRGRQMKLRAGQLLPWARAPLGYRVDPERPRDPAGLRRGRSRRRHRRTDLRLVFGRARDSLQRRQTANRRASANAFGDAAVECRHRAGHSAQSALHRHGLRQPHPRRCGARA